MTDLDDAAPEVPTSSRRDVLIGGAAGVGIVTAGGLLAGCATDDPVEATGASTDVLAFRVSEVPVDDPYSSRWERSTSSDWAVASVGLEGQSTVRPTRAEPSVPTISVSALHDGSHIGFRLSWVDEQVDDLTIKTDAFRDACAVLLAGDVTDQAVRFMGTGDGPATILHWKADWQRDVDHGFQGLSVAFPNGTFDYYPPLETIDGDAPTVVEYTAADAEQWLPGMAVDNPISQPTKISPVEKALARGVGTLETLPTQNAIGRGVFADGLWSVVIAKPLAAADDLEMALSPGGQYAMATAVWSGRDRDAGGHKSPSRSLLRLRLAP